MADTPDAVAYIMYWKYLRFNEIIFSFNREKALNALVLLHYRVSMEGRLYEKRILYSDFAVFMQYFQGQEAVLYPVRQSGIRYRVSAIYQNPAHTA